MKEWKCKICGYTHEGQEPPNQCPSCKAPKEEFEALMTASAQTVTGPEKREEMANAGPPAEEKPAAAPIVAVDAAKGRRWRCSVCGYIHAGNAPPDKCPICQAPAEKFVELDRKGKPVNKASAATAVAKPGIMARIFLSLHIHPILAHFPNGILPMVVLFMAGSIFLSYDTFVDNSTFYSLIFVLITMPFVLASGFFEWKKRYGGARTVLFAVKIFCAFLAAVCLAILVLWRTFDTEVMLTSSPYRLIYFVVAVIMLLAVVMAGHLGGRLVFRDRDR